MKNRVRNFFLGKPLKDSELVNERLNVFWGMPVFSSDTISTVAYAGEEILFVLLPVLGVSGFGVFMPIVAALVAFLVILVLSYRQTIDAYPQGGGAYTVAMSNLGERWGLVAGASLVVGYIMIVAVSVSAAAAAVTSAFPALESRRLWIALLLIALLAWLHLRGTSAASVVAGVPTYLFVLSLLVMIAVGLTQWVRGGYPLSSSIPVYADHLVSGTTILRAFASGCTALAGIEAVSNGVANFKEPATRTAKGVLLLMAVVVGIIFLGVSLLMSLYRMVPTEETTTISRLAGIVFGTGSPMFYLIQALTLAILTLAANTAYADLPHLMAMMAEDSYLPRRLIFRGSRLNYSNGILFLSASAAAMVVAFGARQHALLPLYVSGVFISFFLNQLGMLRYWHTWRGKGWPLRVLINGAALLATTVTLAVLIVTRFLNGAWLTLLVIALLAEMMLAIRNHYRAASEDLRLSGEEAKKMLGQSRSGKAVLPIRSLNRSFIKAYNCACDMGFSSIELFHIASDEAEALALKKQVEELGLDCSFAYEVTEYRNSEDVLIRHIEAVNRTVSHNEHLTVVIPHIVTLNPFKQYLHNEVSRVLLSRLARYRYVYIFQVPYLFE